VSARWGQASFESLQDARDYQNILTLSLQFLGFVEQTPGFYRFFTNLPGKRASISDLETGCLKSANIVYTEITARELRIIRE
jgi:hypothetical protein